MVRKASFVTILFLLILIAVMTTVCTIHANPVGGTCLSVTPPLYVSKTLGEVFTVGVNIANVADLRVFEFKLAYDNKLLDVVEVVQGSFFPPPPKASIEKLEINRTIGFVWVRISLSGSEATVNGSGALAIITFNDTFTPEPPEIAFCVLDLCDTFLYDHSMTTITHDAMVGLYFCGSIHARPSVNGRLLDLYTQRGGIGQGTRGGVFMLGEMVKLSANLTYNDYPVQQKLVSFAVSNPENGTILTEATITNNEGVAIMDFRIPYLPESVGTWTVVATAAVAEVAVWDFLTFEVIRPPPPYGPKANFTESTERPHINETVKFDASNSLPGWNGTDIMPITEYRWDFGDGNKTTTTTPIVYHAYKQSLVYYVTLTVYAPGATPETDTSPTERKVIGGYSALIKGPTIAKPLTLYSTMLAISAVAFTLARRRKNMT